MGLADWFSSFCSNIQVQDGGTISRRYRAITHRLNTDFWEHYVGNLTQPLRGLLWPKYSHSRL